MQWRVQDIPERGAPTPKAGGGAPTYYLTNGTIHKAKDSQLHGFDWYYSIGVVDLHGDEWEERLREGTLPTIPYQPLASWIAL